MTEENLKEIIANLARDFYAQGWFPGSGGSLSIRESPDRIYITPSGVQKERLEPEDIFIVNSKGEVIDGPDPKRNLKPSQTTPLYITTYKERPEIGAIVHSHDANIVLASMLYSKEFKIKGQTMNKMIYNFVEQRYGYFDEELVIPIVPNARQDIELCGPVSQVIRDYPQSNAVILKEHGINVYGKDWKQCKLMAESYSYLAKIAVESHKCGVNPYTKACFDQLCRG